MNIILNVSLLGILSLFHSSIFAAKEIVLDPTYAHDKYVTMPRDVVKEFRAYTSSMDSLDDDDNYGDPEANGTPEWVAYQIKAYSGECIPTKSRPKWSSEKKFVTAGISPEDSSYGYSRAFRNSHKDWFVRGHLQMKLIAERMGNDAASNTHTFLNAVPQRSKFNSGIWLDLEMATSAWADIYGSVWVVTGPIYADNFAYGFIGEEDEFKVAIPEALFKIVIRESNTPDKLDVLAFVYPQIGAGYYNKEFDHTKFLTSVDEVELMTGLDFLTSVSDELESKLESKTASEIWGYDVDKIVRACRKQP